MVESFPHDFVLACEGRLPADVVRAALPPRFDVAPEGRPRTLRLTWLDTFDWRLHQAGLTLQHSAGSRASDYTLTGDDGEQVTASAKGLRWPALAGALPPGPLRARLQPLTEVRALMPTARATATVRQMRVLNADEKTVAWLTVTDLSLAGKNGTGLPPRLSVTAVRGYQAQTGRIARSLAAAAGVTPAAASPLDDVLAAAGRHPGDYSSKIDVKLTAGMPARCALEEVLLRLLDTLEANVPGTIRDTDTEFLHDLRVAVRRTRSAIKLCGDVLPAGVAGGVQRRIQVAGRRDHPDPRPRRLPARLRHDGGRAARRPRRPSWSRSTAISSSGARSRSGTWRGPCAPAASWTWPRPGARSSPPRHPGAASPPPPWPPTASAGPTGRC